MQHVYWSAFFLCSCVIVCLPFYHFTYTCLYFLCSCDFKDCDQAETVEKQMVQGTSDVHREAEGLNKLQKKYSTIFSLSPVTVQQLGPWCAVWSGVELQVQISVNLWGNWKTSESVWAKIVTQKLKLKRLSQSQKWLNSDWSQTFCCTNRDRNYTPTDTKFLTQIQIWTHIFDCMF